MTPGIPVVKPTKAFPSNAWAQTLLTLVGWALLNMATHAAQDPAPQAAAHQAPPSAPHAASSGRGASAPVLAPPAPTPTANTGDLETLRQRLNARVAAVRAKQENEELRVLNTAPHDKTTARKTHPPRDTEPPAAALHSAVHWGYTGAGAPEQWGRLKPEYSLCERGLRQSPIDIREGVRVDLEPIRFDYRPSAFNVVDNGHTVQVNLGPGNTISVGARRFELVQFHFHRPSEERINGRQFDMVAHLVHKDPEGRLAVVAVLLDQGKQHPLVQQVWSNLPLEQGLTEVASTPIDLNALLPEDRRYFTYMGSLTTPPCSEGVLWLVLKQPATVSVDQIAVFSRLYPMNARPIQRTANRLIKEAQ